MSKITYEECFGSAKAIANLIPIAINQGADPADIQQAVWGVAHLIEMGWTNVEDSFQESVQAGAAALAEEREERCKHSRRERCLERKRRARESALRKKKAR